MISIPCIFVSCVLRIPNCCVLRGAFQVALLVKNSPAGAGDRCLFDPWVVSTPWSRKWRPVPVFLPGKSHRHRSPAAAVHGLAKSQTQQSTYSENSLYILDRTLLSNRWFAVIFSQPIICLFFLSFKSLSQNRSFRFGEVQLVNFSFTHSASGMKFISILPGSRSQRLFSFLKERKIFFLRFTSTFYV